MCGCEYYLCIHLRRACTTKCLCVRACVCVLSKHLFAIRQTTSTSLSTSSTRSSATKAKAASGGLAVSLCPYPTHTPSAYASAGAAAASAAAELVQGQFAKASNDMQKAAKVEVPKGAMAAKKPKEILHEQKIAKQKQQEHYNKRMCKESVQSARERKREKETKNPDRVSAFRQQQQQSDADGCYRC